MDNWTSIKTIKREEEEEEEEDDDEEVARHVGGEVADAGFLPFTNLH